MSSAGLRDFIGDMGTFSDACSMSSASLSKLHEETGVDAGLEVRNSGRNRRLGPREGCHLIV